MECFDARRCGFTRRRSGQRRTAVPISAYPRGTTGHALARLPPRAKFQNASTASTPLIAPISWTAFLALLFQLAFDLLDYCSAHDDAVGRDVHRRKLDTAQPGSQRFHVAAAVRSFAAEAADAACHAFFSLRREVHKSVFAGRHRA